MGMNTVADLGRDMKIKSCEGISNRTYAAFLFLFLVIGTVFRQPAFSQSHGSVVSGCKVGVEAPAYGFWTWPAKSQVKVYVLSADFKTEEIPYLIAPLQSWNEVGEATGSRVSFTYEGVVSAPQHCASCLTIMRGKVFDKSKRHAAELQAYSAHSDQLITHANIVIDPVITDPRALSNAVAHELGHNFGLLDCYSCRKNVSVMNVINDPNGLKAPTRCDIAQVKRAYEELKVHVRPSPVAVKIPVDVGEEPVDDDTPIIDPNP